MIERNSTLQVRANFSKAKKGVKQNPRQAAIRAAAMGRPETRKKLSDSHTGLKWSDSQRIKMEEFLKSEEYRNENSNRAKGLWKNPEYVKRQMQARHVHKNKLESKFERICVENGWSFRFVGDGAFIVGGKCPDFYDGSNKLIEIFGDYWHRNDDPNEKVSFYEKFGYKCIVIWENEINNHLDKVVDSVNRFV